MRTRPRDYVIAAAQGVLRGAGLLALAALVFAVANDSAALTVGVALVGFGLFWADVKLEKGYRR